MTAAVATTLSPPPRPPAPFMKWAGGKRRLLPAILARLPEGVFEHYFEPFVGGGAVFFELAALGRIKHVTLADANVDLVRAYLAVQNDPERLIECLKDPRFKNDSESFYAVRAGDPETMQNVEAAARMIYLNRTCFNGLYRVNKSGGFNAPFGRYANPRICDEEGIRAASRALQIADVRLTDFEVVMDDAREGVCYCDSPYAPASVTSNFTSYTQDGFSFGDQERLRDAARSASRRGVFVLLSNSDVPMIRKLYSGDDFQLDEIMAARAINSDASKRGSVKELLIRCVAR